MNDFIVIPGTGIRLYDGYIVTLADYPGDTFIVKHGYYHNAEDTEVFGWYFISTLTSLCLAVTDELLLTATILMPTYPGPGLEDDEPFTAQLKEQLLSAFITVDTLADLDNLALFSDIPNGKLVKVNDAGDSKIGYYTAQIDDDNVSWVKIESPADFAISGSGPIKVTGTLQTGDATVGLDIQDPTEPPIVGGPVFHPIKLTIVEDSEGNQQLAIKNNLSLYSYKDRQGNIIDGAVSNSFSNVTTGRASAAFGSLLSATESCQVVVGRCNKSNSQSLFIVGNGVDDFSRSNAIEVHRDGTIVVQGDLVVNNKIVNQLVDRHTEEIEAIEDTIGEIDQELPNKVNKNGVMVLVDSSPDSNNVSHESNTLLLPNWSGEVFQNFDRFNLDENIWHVNSYNKITPVSLPISKSPTSEDIWITSQDAWNSFMSDGNTYAGQTVHLATNVSCSPDHVKSAFSGTLDGNGYTIDLYPNNNQWLGVFDRLTGNVLIKDLRVRFASDSYSLAAGKSILVNIISANSLVEFSNVEVTSTDPVFLEIAANTNRQSNSGIFIGIGNSTATILFDRCAIGDNSNQITQRCTGRYVSNFMGNANSGTVKFYDCISYANIEIQYDYNNSPTIAAFNAAVYGGYCEMMNCVYTGFITHPNISTPNDVGCLMGYITSGSYKTENCYVVEQRTNNIYAEVGLKSTTHIDYILPSYLTPGAFNGQMAYDTNMERLWVTTPLGWRKIDNLVNGSHNLSE